MKLLRQVGPHPFLASAYPSLALLAANLGQVRPSIVVRPLALSLLGGFLLVGLLRLWLKDWARAGLLATGWLVLFFGYGPVYQALKAISIGGATIGRHRFLVPTWLVLAVAGAWLVAGRRIVVPAWSRLLSTALGLAVLLPLGQLGWSTLSAAADSNFGPSDLSAQIEARAGHPESLPDIYYIILDAYARADTLGAAFDLDNSGFLDDLRSLGFYVAECSQSNYSQTELSLGSSLNMGYLEDLVVEPLVQETDRQRLWPLLRHSLVRSVLEELGYTTVAFETGYYWTEWEDADLYLAPAGGWLSGMTAFEATLLRSTAAWAAIDAAPVLPAGLLRDMDRSTAAHRSRVLFVLNELSHMAEVPGPKFVFVHLVSPHRPFVFDALGNPVEDDYTWTRSHMGLGDYIQGYREQVRYLNSQVLPILSRLIADSDPAPVIIMQGDHGPEEGSSEERMRNLSVYFLGDAGLNGLYPSITPVNSFRVALAARFGLELPLLEDVSYFSTYDRPFEFTIIDESCPAES
ncbi:MAG TPA: hypothetical protein VJ345_10705 [Anaerolineales bacterium]|nr:hypothetical protein [Anaerolineales bacterium]